MSSSAFMQWAHARSLVMHDGRGYRSDWTGDRWGVHVDPLAPKSTVLICSHGDELFGTEATPHTALVWALVIEARPLRDGGRCKRCRGRGTWDDWSIKHWHQDGFKPSPWKCTIPCPACDGTGLADMTDAYAQHVLDAQPSVGSETSCMPFKTEQEADDRAAKEDVGPRGFVRSSTRRETGFWQANWTGTKPGNHASIEALHVLADRLQASACSTCGRLGIEATCPCGGTLVDRTWLGLAIAHLLAGMNDRELDLVARLTDATRSRVGDANGSPVPV